MTSPFAVTPVGLLQLTTPHPPTLPTNSSVYRKVFLYLCMLTLFPPLEMLYFYFFFIYLFYIASPMYRVLLAIYWTNMFFEIDGFPSSSGWGGKWWPFRKFCRSLRCWHWIREYFDGELVKTAELPGGKPYLMCYHPHGIISMGLQGSLALEACGFSETFPGVDRSVATLVASFKIPFFREWILMNGFIACGRKTLMYHLNRNKTVVLVPGGANEALHSHPGMFKLHLKNRKGFVRIALLTGASLVPCLGMGENEMFHTLDNESDGFFPQMLYKVQVFLMKRFTFSFPLMSHILPFREKVTCVVGAPLACPKTEDPSQEVIDKYHKLYVDSLTKLYEKHKDYYGKGIKLEIV